MARSNKRRVGGWLPSDPELIRKFVEKLRSRPKADPADYIPPIKDLQNLVASTPTLAALTQVMFVEGYDYDPENPLGQPSVTSWPEFLGLLNAIMTTAPEFYVDAKGEALGLVGFPINALLDWPMGTGAGYTVFSSELFNRAFQPVLRHWSAFLTSEASRYVLAESDPKSDPPVVAWLSDDAKAQMIAVACQPSGGSADCLSKSFTEIFQVPDPNDPVYLGFASWDDFFTREFQPGVRPVGDAPVVSACESAPLQVVTNVGLSDRFWLKGQPYSLNNMLGFHPKAAHFQGGSVYQAFLSALSYHRWNAPVDGTVEDAFVINGSYYLESMSEGVHSPDPDPSAPNASQPFITSVATRAVIFIRATDPGIGLMAFVAVGMAEVSSCQIQVKPGDVLSKGDPLGMFHFGGSTHCLVFGPDVSLKFRVPVSGEPNLDATNVAVKSNLATLA
ncbi:phosphatidylserine decarboxylase family protein [Breoghania sp. L-A4]|uniref:phosphatidylserine decarboxylase family protein n=1 Tax=Breoghania sp. L-A4 TaxID=2304600 RepID=UPI000E35A798|nr:phosphatidylserine decarboxylase family protein [Breoghania sp. L-A4]AXS39511.1 phosphatidylserine decarboxylase family protein [Breoghania sp. L-A4]